MAIHQWEFWVCDTDRCLNYRPELKVEDEDHTTSVFCVHVKQRITKNLTKAHIYWAFTLRCTP